MMRKKFERVLIDIDTQRDFIDPDGALFFEGAEKTIPNLEKLFAWAADRGVPIISTVDSHDPDDPEFADWPPHCVLDTWGHEKLPETLIEPRKVVRREGETLDIGSLFDTYRQVIFQKQTIGLFDNPALQQVISELDVDCYIVCGVATDYCVRSMVEKLLEMDRCVELVVDAIEGIDKQTSGDLVKTFISQGVAPMTTAALVARQEAGET